MFRAGLNGAVSGVLGGAAFGGVTGGVSSYLQGNNVWTGSAIAPGRGAFSIKNTPVTQAQTAAPVAPEPDALPGQLRPDVPTESPQQAVLIEKQTQPNVLYHYTSAQGYKGIIESGEIRPSIGYKHARYGDGQYFTDLLPSDYTVGQMSRQLYGVPWKTRSLEYMFKIDMNGLNVIKNGPHNFFVPNNAPLNIRGRIIDSGITIFKIKF